MTVTRAQRLWATAGAAVVAFFVVQRLIIGEIRYPAPPGIIVNGIVIGGLTAMIAFGIALVYRANRIVNFAQGDLGGVGATLAVLLIVGPRVPYFVAMLTGIAGAVVLGAVVELLVIRRFFRAPRLILTVATIGLAQILAFGEITMPQLFDLTVPPQSFPSPFDFSFEIAPVIFRGNDIVAMMAVPVAIAGLAAFFRYTNIGIAVRASAESADRAFLLGIPVKRIHTIVWVIATVLATVAVMLRAGIVGLPIGTVLGPGILLRALAAAVIGRMERLVSIFAAAVVLGIAEQSVLWHSGRGLLADAVLFGVVVVALLLQRRSAARSEPGDASSWHAAAEVRPLPQELAALPEVRWGLRYGPAALAGLAAVALPLVLSESRTNLLAVVAIWAVIGLSLVVLTGWAGQISLGQMAFVGFGAATAGALTVNAGVDLLVSLVAAGLCGAVVATIIGIPALRIRGLFLAVTTLAFALATSSYFLNFEFFGPGTRLLGVPVGWLATDRVDRDPVFGHLQVASETQFYYFTLAALAFAIFAAQGIRKARTGRLLIGIRENEKAAQGFGVNVTRMRLTAFAISGFLAAYAGGLLVHHQQSIEISSFVPGESLKVFTMVVIGGLGSIPGAVIGAVYVRGIEYFLPAGWRFLASGIGLLIVLMVIPAGLGPALYGLRDRALRLIARRRGIVVPSLVADVAAAEPSQPPARRSTPRHTEARARQVVKG